MNDRTEELRNLAEDWAAVLRSEAAFLVSALTDDFVGIGPLALC